MDQVDRYKTLLEAIELERQEEEQYYQKIDKAKSIQDKINAGVYWHSAILSKKHFGAGELIELVFEKNKHLDVQDKFKNGMACTVFASNDLKNGFKGIISFAKRTKMAVMVHPHIIEINDFPSGAKYDIQLVHDERPYRVMKDAVHELIYSKDERIKDLREAIRRKSKISNKRNETDHSKLTNHGLNEIQAQAVNTIVKSDLFGIIHGPPGTGKSTTIVALVRKLVQIEKKILICAPSNNAVDLLVRRLDSFGIPVLRIGHVTRVGDHVNHLTLSEQLRNHGDWAHIKKVRIEAEAALKQAKTHKRKYGATERAERTMLFKEARELRKWAKDLEERLVEQIISESKVVACTLIGSADLKLEGVRFNTLIIDEASQTLEPECWVAMLKAERSFLVGDHMQLPPTVKSKKAKDLGLDVTLLDRMSGHVEYSYLLKTQYRMNNAILAFPNQSFYNGSLQSDPSVKNRRLYPDDIPFTFIDTSGCGFEETRNNKTLSLKNEGEFFILREHFIQNHSNYTNSSIAIITPYAEQVRFIRDQIGGLTEWHGYDIEVDSVDGFQGQERDVVYLSLVRSNDRNDIGFVSDFRRLNVAMTRAKMKLIIIGDLSTLSSNPLFQSLADFCEHNNAYQSAWEYMNFEDQNFNY